MKKTVIIALSLGLCSLAAFAEPSKTLNQPPDTPTPGPGLAASEAAAAGGGGSGRIVHSACDNPDKSSGNGIIMNGQDPRMQACVNDILAAKFWKLLTTNAAYEAQILLSATDKQNSQSTPAPTPAPSPSPSPSPSPPLAQPTPAPTETSVPEDRPQIPATTPTPAPTETK